MYTQHKNQRTVFFFEILLFSREKPMADDDDTDEEQDEEQEDGGENESGGDNEDEDEDEEGGSSSSGGKKKLIIIAGLVLLLLLGGAAAAYFTGLLEPLLGGDGQQAEEEATPQDATFYDLPELLVNLSTTGRNSTFLKIRISLELVRPEDVQKIESVMPRIIDNFQVYLRELRVEDLKGSAGMYRLREELLKRVAVAMAPAKINDVLFKEMIIQ